MSKKASRRAKKRLEERIKSYDTLKKQQGAKRPGSRNTHKN